MNGSGNYSPGGGGGGSPRRGGHNFGGNPGQHNSLEYMRAVSSSLYIPVPFSLPNLCWGRGAGGGNPHPAEDEILIMVSIMVSILA